MCWEIDFEFTGWEEEDWEEEEGSDGFVDDLFDLELVDEMEEEGEMDEEDRVFVAVDDFE